MAYRNIHMIGIGGIGMSALAQLYHVRGYEVTGSDRSESPTTALLSGQGIPVHIGQDAKHVPDVCDLVVYSDAIPEDNVERVRAREQGITEQSYYTALGEATKEGTSIVVSGTHGKTTTTAMLAKVLIEAGKRPTVLCGSLMSEYGSNFVAGRDDLYVIEGCEYKRHFTKLHPTIFVITNIEYDHTDYYKDLPDMQSAFKEGVALLPESGTIVTNPTDTTIHSVLEGSRRRVVSYLDVTVPKLTVPGTFNTHNARAAKAAALALDPALDEASIDTSLVAFRGTWRRFEYKGKTKEDALVYDDYAHHPTAIRATLDMARAEFPDKKIIVAFHPHLYSRTRDLMDGFVEALALADEVLLAPIYPAREEPIEGVTSEVLAEKISARGTPAIAFTSLDEVEHALRVSSPFSLLPSTLLLTMGAGDIYQVAEKILGH